MKIAFWSNSRGRSGVTSNLACVSVISGLLVSHKAVLFENHGSMNGLASAFSRKSDRDRVLCETSPYLNLFGQSSISLLEDNLYYIPGTKAYNEETREFWMQKHVQNMMSVMDEWVEDVYVDTASSCYESSRIILQEADLVVVNLTQNPQLLQHYFQNFADIQKKAFYLIGHYSRESVFSKEYICQTYGVPEEKIAVIPYHIPFSDSLANGRAISFLQDNLNCPKSSIHYEFMKEAVCCVKKLENLSVELSVEKRPSATDGPDSRIWCGI